MKNGARVKLEKAVLKSGFKALAGVEGVVVELYEDHALVDFDGERLQLPHWSMSPLAPEKDAKLKTKARQTEAPTLRELAPKAVVLSAGERRRLIDLLDRCTDEESQQLHHLLKVAQAKRGLL